MIDLQELRQQADAGDGHERVPITRNALRQIVREIEQGRAAQAMRQGQQRLDGVVAQWAGAACLDVGNAG